jgi:hypothetical protein
MKRGAREEDEEGRRRGEEEGRRGGGRVKKRVERDFERERSSLSSCFFSSLRFLFRGAGTAVMRSSCFLRIRVKRAQVSFLLPPVFFPFSFCTSFLALGSLCWEGEKKTQGRRPLLSTLRL